MPPDHLVLRIDAAQGAAHRLSVDLDRPSRSFLAVPGCPGSEADRPLQAGDPPERREQPVARHSSKSDVGCGRPVTSHDHRRNRWLPDRIRTEIHGGPAQLLDLIAGGRARRWEAHSEAWTGQAAQGNSWWSGTDSAWSRARAAASTRPRRVSVRSPDRSVNHRDRETRTQTPLRTSGGRADHARVSSAAWVSGTMTVTGRSAHHRRRIPRGLVPHPTDMARS